jgi:Holliday junction resolvase
MSNASRGAAFERRVRDLFVKAGWDVTRSPASKGCADLVCIEPGGLRTAGDGIRSWVVNEIAYVQCKSGAWRVDPGEWNALYDHAMRYGGVPLIAHRPKRGRIELLRVLGRKSGIRGARPPCEPWDGLAGREAA